MTPLDLPSLTPATYGRANELKRELTQAVRYALLHGASKAGILAVIDAASALIEPPEEAE